MSELNGTKTEMETNERDRKKEKNEGRVIESERARDEGTHKNGKKRKTKQRNFFRIKFVWYRLEFCC